MKMVALAFLAGSTSPSPAIFRRILVRDSSQPKYPRGTDAGALAAQAPGDRAGRRTRPGPAPSARRSADFGEEGGALVRRGALPVPPQGVERRRCRLQRGPQLPRRPALAL